MEEEYVVKLQPTHGNLIHKKLSSFLASKKCFLTTTIFKCFCFGKLKHLTTATTSDFLTCMQVSEVRIFNIGMELLQVIAKFHWNISTIFTLGAVIHFHTFMFACVQDMLADVFSTVRPKIHKEIAALYIIHIHLDAE